MTFEEQRKNDELREDLTKKIAQTEETMDELKREERFHMEQIERSRQKLEKENHVFSSILEKLHAQGDEDVPNKQYEFQNIHTYVKNTLNQHQETISQEYRSLNRQLDETREDFYRERGKIEW